MDIVFSNSTLLFTQSLPPLRAVTSIHKLNFTTATTALTSSSAAAAAKKGLFFRIGPQRKLSLSSPIAPTFPRFTIRCGAASGITEINESEFLNTVLKSDRPVLVEFVANWCGPCRLIAPAIESLAQEYGDRLMVVKIDHDSNPRLIEEYKIYGLPTLILFKNGQEVPESRREGAITKVKLKEYIDSLLDAISVL